MKGFEAGPNTDLLLENDSRFSYYHFEVSLCWAKYPVSSSFPLRDLEFPYEYVLTKIIISNHGMEVHGHVHILEVALPRGIPELSVVPVHDGDAVGLPL